MITKEMLETLRSNLEWYYFNKFSSESTEDQQKAYANKAFGMQTLSLALANTEKEQEDVLLAWGKARTEGRKRADREKKNKEITA